MTKRKHTLFPYTWHIDENETEETHIRFYGIDENKKNICVRINDFKPYVFI